MVCTPVACYVQPMSRRRFENLDADRQQRLFESAALEFGEKGFDAASLNRIIEQAGMSKSSLYYYFEDKADLFSTLLERALAFVVRQIGHFDPEAMTAESYWSDLEALYLRAFKVIGKNTWLTGFGKTFYSLRGTAGEERARGRLFEAARLWVGRVIARGQALGVVRSDLPQPLLVDCAMGLVEALDRWGVAHWQEIDPQDWPETARLHVDLLRRLLSSA